MWAAERGVASEKQRCTVRREILIGDDFRAWTRENEKSQEEKAA
jgi:hypothetical protein